jgi:hypothetical protein
MISIMRKNIKNDLPATGGLSLLGSGIFGLGAYSYTSTLEFNQAKLLESRGQLEQNQLPEDIAKREANFQYTIQSRLEDLQSASTSQQRLSILMDLKQSLSVERQYQEAHKQHCSLDLFQKSLECTRTQLDFEAIINGGLSEFDPTGRPNIPAALATPAPSQTN